MRDARDVVVTRDLTYRQVDGVDLLLDLYRPQGVSSGPAVVYVHGGAWLMGDRGEFAERFRALAAAGVAVASIEYRTINLGSYPAQREDILAAVGWLVEHGPELGYTADAVVLMGASAGAHLAALSVLAAPGSVAGFVGLFGRYDLTAAGAAAKPASHLQIPDVVRLSVPPAGFEDLDQRAKLALLAGVDRSELTEAVLASISPIEQVHDGAPPVLLLNGTADAMVHHAHSLRFAEALVAAGTREEVSVTLVPGANHEDPVFADADSVGVIAAFVHRCAARVAARAYS